MNQWIRLGIDLVAIFIVTLSSLAYFDNRFDTIEEALKDRWKGSHMMAWVAGAERAHEEAENPKEVTLPDPYKVRSQVEERSQ